MSGRREAPTYLLRQVASWPSPAGVQQIRWEDQPKEVNGRPLHLLGLVLTMAIQYDAVAASMPSAFPGKRLFDLISRFTFKMGTHVFIDSLRGLHLYHDQMRMMGGVSVFDAPSDVADGDATNATATLRLYIPVALPYAASGAEFDGAIPVAALRSEDMEAVFTSSGAFQEVTFAGLTLDSVTVTVEAYMAALTQVRIPTGWRVTHLQGVTDLERSFPTKGFLSYLDVYDTHAATTPDASSTIYGDVALAIGAGQQDPLSTAALVRRMNIENRMANPAAANVTNSPEFVPLIRTQARGLATRQPIGRVRVKLASRATYTSTRYQWRERGTRTDELMRIFAERLGISKDGLVVKARTSKKTPDLDGWLRPHFDASVSWAGVPFAALRETPGA